MNHILTIACFNRTYRDDSLPPNQNNIATTGTNQLSNQFSTIMIDDIEWNSRIQDIGTNDKKNMPQKSYKSKQISPYGPNKLYFYHLNAIAIDYITSFKNNPSQWSRVPLNQTNVKKIIIELVLELRSTDDTGVYEMDQLKFIEMVYKQWGGAKPPANITDSDKLRVLGLIMSRPENFYILQQLSEGLLE